MTGMTKEPYWVQLEYAPEEFPGGTAWVQVDMAKVNQVEAVYGTNNELLLVAMFVVMGDAEKQCRRLIFSHAQATPALECWDKFRFQYGLDLEYQGERAKPVGGGLIQVAEGGIEQAVKNFARRDKL